MTFDSKAYAEQLEAKVTRLRDLLAPFDAPEPTVFDSPLANFRLRAEFRLWREGGERHYAMFSQDDKRTPILIEEFPIASLRINQLMPQLKAAWQASCSARGLMHSLPSNKRARFMPPRRQTWHCFGSYSLNLPLRESSVHLPK